MLLRAPMPASSTLKRQTPWPRQGDQQPLPLFTRIHRTDSALVDNAPTQSGARTMALDTKTHSILLVTARHGTGNAFQVLPNTFVGLVIAKLRPK